LNVLDAGAEVSRALELAGLYEQATGGVDTKRLSSAPIFAPSAQAVLTQFGPKPSS
jgi:hypothetical protein